MPQVYILQHNNARCCPLCCPRLASRAAIDIHFDNYLDPHDTQIFYEPSHVTVPPNNSKSTKKSQPYPLIPLVVDHHSPPSAPLAAPDSAMDSDSSAVSASVKDGSTLYYSLLHSTTSARQNTYRLLSLTHTLANALVEVREPQVAEKKIHWWHEEVDRLLAQQPRHPATVGSVDALMPDLKSQPDILKQHLLAILAANNNDKYQNSADSDIFEQRLIDDFGARLELIMVGLANARAHESRNSNAANPDVNGPPPMATDIATRRTLAIGFGLHNQLLQCHKLHFNGYPVWPDSLYEEHSLEPAQLADKDVSAKCLALFEALYQQAITALDEGLSGLPQVATGSAESWLPIYINATLRRHQLALWQQKQCNPMQTYMTLTPLKKAWLGWRAKRRFLAQISRNVP